MSCAQKQWGMMGETITMRLCPCLSLWGCHVTCVGWHTEHLRSPSSLTPAAVVQAMSAMKPLCSYSCVESVPLMMDAAEQQWESSEWEFKAKGSPWSQTVPKWSFPGIVNQRRALSLAQTSRQVQEARRVSCLQCCYRFPIPLLAHYAWREMYRLSIVSGLSLRCRSTLHMCDQGPWEDGSLYLMGTALTHCQVSPGVSCTNTLLNSES